MPSDTKNVKLGVCTVTYDGVDLGYTKGGVEVTVKTETKKVMVDQFGNSEINEYIMSRSCAAKVPLAETTLDNMVRIMPGAVMTATGAAKASGTITFTAVPVANDTITINGVVYTYKANPGPSATDLAIPASVAAAAVSLTDAINKSVDPKIEQVIATVAAGVVTLTADDNGSAFNAYTLAKSSAGVTLSGANLTGGTDAGKRKVTVPNGVGTSLLSIAKKLVLHPIALPADNRSEDFTMPIAATAGDITFSYKVDDERVFSCEFTAYPDPVSRTLFIVGDESAA